MISSSANWEKTVKTTILQMLGGHIEFPEPDFRLKYLLEHFPGHLNVVEFGCWHGWHTVPLARHFQHVTAIDIRPDNIAKALLRANLLQLKNVDFHVANVECFDFKTDVLVHVGVLYHLANPVEHLHHVLPKCNVLCLDTHINKPELVPINETYDGQLYSGGVYREHGWSDPLSGICETSIWLDEVVLKRVLNKLGFEIINERRHNAPPGPRIALVAIRPTLFV